MLRDLLWREGISVGRRQVRTLMQRMGIEALYRKPRNRPLIAQTASTSTGRDTRVFPIGRLPEIALNCKQQLLVCHFTRQRLLLCLPCHLECDASAYLGKRCQRR